MRAERTGCRVAVAVAAAACCCRAGPGEAQTRSLLDSCWTPAALAARPGENVPLKRNHHFDAPSQAAPLAAFAPLSYAPKGVVRGVTLPPGRKLIALTFDLCEQPGEVAGYDGAIVDYLRRENVRATFFAGGKWLRSHEERARQLMADPLFEIGNHAEAHRNLRELKGERLRAEIAGPQRAYEAIRERLVATQCVKAASGDMPPIAPRMGLFRFPYGACNDRALQAVSDQGLRAIQWDLATGDPAPKQSAKAIARLMIAKVRPGSIVVAHANGKGWHTAEALPLAIPKLRSLGFEFVTVSELLAAGKPVISQTCYDTHPGDLDRYDVLAAHDHPLVHRHAIPNK